MISNMPSQSMVLSTRLLLIWRRRILALLRMLLEFSVLMYGLLVIITLMLRLVMGDANFHLLVLNTFLHWVWVPSLVLFPVCLALKKRRLSLITAPGFFAFLFVYGGQFVPSLMRPPMDSPQFTLMTYNTRIRPGWDFNAVIALVEESDADIVVFQEMTQISAKALETKLSYRYPYAAFHTVTSSSGGQGMLSRFPIHESSFWQYDWLPHPLGHQRAVIDVHSTTVVIYNVHPTHPGLADDLTHHNYRNRELDDLMSRVASETAPVIMAGDFNMSDLSEAYQIVSNQMTDSYRVAGFGMGFTHPEFVQGNSYGQVFPNDFPIPHLVRLDYVFYSQGIHATEAKVWHESGGSDHRPVFVRLSLTQ